MFTLNPKALDNRLYFTEDGKELFYDTEQLDKDTFMNHKDMMPGKQYEDILTISNGSSNTCKLYFKVVERDQSKLAGELLENINMQIYIDNELIYDGNAKGLDSKELPIGMQIIAKIKTITRSARVVVRLDARNISTVPTTAQIYANKSNRKSCTKNFNR